MNKIARLIFSTAVSLTVVYAVGRALDQAICEAFIRPPEYEPTWLQWESGALFLGFVAGSVLLSRFSYRHLSKIGRGAS
jgi:hypothetical protein